MFFKRYFKISLQNGAELDYGRAREKQFDAKCPEGGRVSIHGEAVREPQSGL